MLRSDVRRDGTIDGGLPKGFDPLSTMLNAIA
ncbi:hypothetical protein QE385_003918 [Sphingomonas sp. SORGH_AS 950]|nr:hypothetical protein [Sphingomonas sp. SORGH_AS_0950]